MMRLLLTCVTFATICGFAAAQPREGHWPDRPIRLIVPFPPGSSTDIVARIAAQHLSTRLQQQFVIDNRAGASGNLGADAVAKAAPDGSTIGIATASTHAVAVALGNRLPYDPIKDFAPIAMLGTQPYVLVLYPGVKAKDVGELVALAKANPAGLSYGSAGVASLAHLATALFAHMAGISLTHVPYKSSAQSLTDIMTGRMDMQFATIGPTLPTIHAGQLRAIATTGERRATVLPEVPTVAEAGLTGYEASLWVALVAPAGTPSTFITRLNRELTDFLNSAEGKDALLAQGIESEPGSPEAVAARIHSDIEKWRSVIIQAGIRAE
ncbi:MAG: tripartite tricarboxylate transporter substrate binding protein [Xanthobacteraceae bacterium]